MTVTHAGYDLQWGKFRSRALDGEYRSISYDGVEILKRVAVAIRDADWATIAWRRDDFSRKDDSPAADSRTADSRIDKPPERVRWALTSASSPCPMRANFGFEPRHDGFVVRFEGTIVSAFSANRLGIYFLQPLSLQGTRATITQNDGTVHECRYPRDVAPHPLFTRAVRIAYSTSGLDTVITISGSTFEAEDQRNWIDDSFKVYCPPLAEPYPVTYSVGESVVQTLSVSITESGRPAVRRRDRAVRKWPDHRPDNGCRFGIWARPYDCSNPEAVTQWLNKVKPSYVRLDVVGPKHAATEPAIAIEPSDRKSPAATSVVPTDIHAGVLHIFDVAICNRVPVEIALHIEPEDPIDEMIELIRSNPGIVTRIVIITESSRTTPKVSVERLRNALCLHGLTIPIGVGTDWFYAEINRARATLTGGDFFHFSFSPQQHNSDAAAVLGTLNALPGVLAEAAAIHRLEPLVITPITFQRRRRPAAPSFRDDWTGVDLNAEYAAPWTVAVCSILAANRVQAATLFSYGEVASLDAHRNSGFARFLAEIYAVSGDHAVTPLRFCAPGIYGISWPILDRTRAWLANCTDTPTSVRVGGDSAPHWKAVTVDVGPGEIADVTV